MQASGDSSFTGAGEPGHTARRCVVIAEDNPVLRGLLADFLRQEGFVVIEAENGYRAVQVAQAASAVDLLITDFAMPRFDGLEVIMRVRAIHPGTPALIMSGSVPDFRAFVGDIERCDTLAKPFLLRTLMEKIRALLSGSELAPGVSNSGAPADTGAASGLQHAGLPEKVNSWSNLRVGNDLDGTASAV
jgi:DNA-binding response OmpR family regulator